MIVHVLIAEAVYDHGVVGVYESREGAVKAAEAIWPTTDGHHGFRVDEREIGRTYSDAFPLKAWRTSPLTTEPVRIRDGSQ
jgi:hypothetical protein